MVIVIEECLLGITQTHSSNALKYNKCDDQQIIAIICEVEYYINSEDTDHCLQRHNKQVH